MDKEEYNRHLSRAMALCSKSEKCRSDIDNLLLKRGVESAEDRQGIISELLSEGFIDEKRYASSYTTEKMRFNRWGLVKVRVMLKAKGISNEHIDMAIAGIDHQGYRETLKNELLKKRKTTRFVNQYDLKGKLMRFAQAKGYETSLIFDVLKEMESNQDSNDM